MRRLVVARAGVIIPANALFMKRILVITNNLQQASFRLRMEALIDLLAQRGFGLEVQVRPRGWLARRRLLRSAGGYDAVILQRKLLDPWDMRLLHRRARKVFFDVDDAVMFDHSRAGMMARWRMWRRFKAVARQVDGIVAGNEYLADLFRRDGRCQAPVTIVPTVVDPAHYTMKQHGPTLTPTLVWIGSNSTLGYLQDCFPALAEAARLVPGLRLLTIAADPPRNPPVPLEHIRWTVTAEAEGLARGAIGIAPMPANRWTLGKCGFKIIQYMAAGLPVIASPVGANAQIVLPGETGLLPGTMSDWPAAIAALANDPALRTKMGAAARRRVEQSYSLSVAVAAWAKVLDGIAD